MAALVLLRLFKAQAQNSSFYPSPRPGQLPSLLKKVPPLACAIFFKELMPGVSKLILFLYIQNYHYATP
jgi:hypothetical protein